MSMGMSAPLHPANKGRAAESIGSSHPAGRALRAESSTPGTRMPLACSAVGGHSCAGHRRMVTWTSSGTEARHVQASGVSLGPGRPVSSGRRPSDPSQLLAVPPPAGIVSACAATSKAARSADTRHTTAAASRSCCGPAASARGRPPSTTLGPRAAAGSGAVHSLRGRRASILSKPPRAPCATRLKEPSHGLRRVSKRSSLGTRRTSRRLQTWRNSMASQHVRIAKCLANAAQGIRKLNFGASGASGWCCERRLAHSMACLARAGLNASHVPASIQGICGRVHVGVALRPDAVLLQHGTSSALGAIQVCKLPHEPKPLPLGMHATKRSHSKHAIRSRAPSISFKDMLPVQGGILVHNGVVCVGPLQV